MSNYEHALKHRKKKFFKEANGNLEMKNTIANSNNSQPNG